MLVGDAMAECELLLRTAGQLAVESKEMKETLSGAVDEMQRHLLLCLGIRQAGSPARRHLVQLETEEILNLSARMLSTIDARSTSRTTTRPQPGARCWQTRRKAMVCSGSGTASNSPFQAKAGFDFKPWKMSTLPAAAETTAARNREFKPEAAAALGALQALVADLAIDLDAMGTDDALGEEDIGGVILPATAQPLRAVPRRRSMTKPSTASRRSIVINGCFHEAANVQIAEFEALLARVRESDGGGLLASTVLSADTGKISS